MEPDVIRRMTDVDGNHGVAVEMVALGDQREVEAIGGRGDRIRQLSERSILGTCRRIRARRAAAIGEKRV